MEKYVYNKEKHFTNNFFMISRDNFQQNNCELKYTF